jgi:hypothetical protein
MSRSNRPLLIVLLLMCVGALALGVVLFGLGGDSPQKAVVPGAQLEEAPPPEVARPEGLVIPREYFMSEDYHYDGATTVVWPVEIELELLTAKHLPQVEGVRPLGYAQSARLLGRIANAQGEGAEGTTVSFSAGPNVGHAPLVCDASGRFGASDLYPGLSLVEVDGPGILGSEREVLLRQGATSELNIGYGRPGSVAGVVYDDQGEPLSDVHVSLDGQRAISGPDGTFRIGRVASGHDMRITLERPGFAALSEAFAVTAGHSLDDKTFRMRRAASLELIVAEPIGAAGLAQVILLPEQILSSREGVARRGFPWHTVNPVEVRPGGRVLVDGLPPERLAVRLFHAGAVADPPVQIVTLKEGAKQSLVLHLAPGPSLGGKLIDPEGVAVRGAHVRLEAPDRTAATLTSVGRMPAFFETEVIPTFPVALQRAVSDDGGRFLFSSYASYSTQRYLVAESADGKLWGARVVGPSEQDVTLKLQPFTALTADLSIEFPGRFQGLPVELWIQGSPIGSTLLGPADKFEVPDLPQGSYRLRARWHGSSILSEAYTLFDLHRDHLRVIGLPEGAVYGQDEDTRLRAGQAGGPGAGLPAMR